MDDMLEIIRSRRSVRHFTDRLPEDAVIDAAIEAGTWAPSGLNNQPWAFAVIKSRETKKALSEFTHYDRVVGEAPVLIAVFLDNYKTYDRTKDCQAIGACMQNMLLYIHSAGLGAVWLGEILKKKDGVSRVLGAPGNLELMGVIALGYPAGNVHGGKRNPPGECVFYRD